MIPAIPPVSASRPLRWSGRSTGASGVTRQQRLLPTSSPTPSTRSSRPRTRRRRQAAQAAAGQGSIADAMIAATPGVGRHPGDRRPRQQGRGRVHRRHEHPDLDGPRPRSEMSTGPGRRPPVRPRLHRRPEGRHRGRRRSPWWSGAVVFMSFSGRPSYAPLFTNLQPSGRRQHHLQAAADKVPYQLADGGTTVMVPANDVDQRARRPGPGRAPGHQHRGLVAPRQGGHHQLPT